MVEGAVPIIDRAQLLADSPGVVRILVQIYLVVGEVVALDVVSSPVELPLLVKEAHVVAAAGPVLEMIMCGGADIWLGSKLGNNQYYTMVFEYILSSTKFSENFT